MTSILECSYIRRRLQEMEEIYPEPHTLEQCDCTSYSYVSLSLILLSVGSYISVLALGNIDGCIFSNLGHMWLVGPIFICSGLMIAVKSILYLRRKTLVKMLSRQRALLRGFHQLAHQSDNLRNENRNDSTQTLPPAYEVLIESQAFSAGGRIPDSAPPSYEEAVFLSKGEVMIILDGKNPSSRPSLCCLSVSVCWLSQLLLPRTIRITHIIYDPQFGTLLQKAAPRQHSLENFENPAKEGNQNLQLNQETNVLS